MKTKLSTFLLSAFLLSLVLFGVAAAYQYRNDVLINNQRDQVALTIKTPSGLTANAMEAYKGTTLLFKVPAAGFRMESGTALTTADGTVTNAFGQTFATAPKVVVTPTSLVPAATNRAYIVSVTTTNFLLNGHTNVTYNYVAIQ